MIYESQGLYAVRTDGPTGGPPNPRLLLKTQERVTHARFSPDGKWIVYTIGDTRHKEVFVQPLAAEGLRSQISSSGGDDPVWRGDGKEILYRKRSPIYSVQVKMKGSSIDAREPEALFDVRIPPLVGDSEVLAVSRDGSRILFPQAVDSLPRTAYVMTDWRFWSQR